MQESPTDQGPRVSKVRYATLQEMCCILSLRKGRGELLPQLPLPLFIKTLLCDNKLLTGAKENNFANNLELASQPQREQGRKRRFQKITLLVCPLQPYAYFRGSEDMMQNLVLFFASFLVASLRGGSEGNEQGRRRGKKHPQSLQGPQSF